MGLVIRLFQGAELIARARWRISTKRKFWWRTSPPLPTKSKAAHLIAHISIFTSETFLLLICIRSDFLLTHTDHLPRPPDFWVRRKYIELDAKLSDDYRKMVTDSTQLLMDECKGRLGHVGVDKLFCKHSSNHQKMEWWRSTGKDRGRKEGNSCEAGSLVN